MATKKAKELAYKAGRALPYVQWPEDATDKQKKVGEHHNPFDNRDPEQQEEYAEWNRGLLEALEDQIQPEERTKLIKDLRDSVKGEDKNS